MRHRSTEAGSSFQSPGLGRGNWRTVANGCRVSVWADEKVLEVDSGDNDTAKYMNVASFRMHAL